jgi:chemotaxis methyl-accepting protein methylase
MRKDSQLNLQADALVQIMNRTHGLDISAYEESFLQKTFARRLTETGRADLEAYGAGPRPSVSTGTST